jgi:hypothetical protein
VIWLRQNKGEALFQLIDGDLISHATRPGEQREHCKTDGDRNSEKWHRCLQQGVSVCRESFVSVIQPPRINLFMKQSI